MSKIVGVGGVTRTLKLLNKETREAVSKQVIKGATDVQAIAVSNIQGGPKTGRTYRKSKNVTHRASAPGESPASDTGNLARRIDIRLSRDKLRAEIGVFDLLSTPYARRLELGDSEIEARPYLQPALKERIRYIRAGVTRALKSTTRRPGK